ncbi:MAG: helix-hairpin-helix domain-containing protein [Pseudomonadota bacterium]
MWLPRPDESMFEYWTSFSPMAPVFGVPWRFSDTGPEVTTRVGGAPRPKGKPSAPVVSLTPAVEAPKPRKRAAPKAKPKKSKPHPVDDLTKIKGVGPKMAGKLSAAGITSYAQIASWDAAMIEKMDVDLGGLPGAIARADWVAQAKALAKG